MAAADTVARQADAYNAHDLETFLACYTEDVVVTSGNGDVLMEGLEAIRAEYAVMFEQLPDSGPRSIHGSCGVPGWSTTPT